MAKPYAMPAVEAAPDVKVAESRISPLVLILSRLVGRLYLTLFAGTARIRLRGERHFLEAFRRALAGESRCILAFRHSSGWEPQVLGWFILCKLPGLARRAGVRFVRPPHTIFIYGYEVARWGGALARFILPGLGALPVHHTKIDSKGMARIYGAITGGPYPVSMAPEGQVSYTAESVPRLEQGVIRMGFQAAEKLEKSGSAVPVEVLPVSMHTRYGARGGAALERLVRKIEGIAGLEARKGTGGSPFTGRMEPCRERILAANEERYGIRPGQGQSFEERMDCVIEAALNRAGEILGMRVQGDVFARMYAMRQTCWDRINIPGMKRLDRLAPLDRSLLDLRAGEAWYAARHLEVADIAWYFRGPLPPDDAPLHVKIEFAQNLWDFASRSRGGVFAGRLNLPPRQVILQAGPVMDLSARLPEYRGEKRRAVEKALEDLNAAFLGCISEVNLAAP